MSAFPTDRPPSAARNPQMDSTKIALLDQARADRERAESYRHLARLITSQTSRDALMKCAAELEDRAGNLESWAAGMETPRGSERVRSAALDPALRTTV